MTGGTIFFNRTGAKVFVTAGALLVESIRALGDFFITLIGIVAFSAGFGTIILIFCQGMMTIATRDPISGNRLIGLVIKQHLARCRCIQ